MNGVILCIMFSLRSVSFHPLLDLVKTGDFSTNGFVCLSQISFVYLDLSKTLVTMQ